MPRKKKEIETMVISSAFLVIDPGKNIAARYRSEKGMHLQWYDKVGSKYSGIVGITSFLTTIRDEILMNGHELPGTIYIERQFSLDMCITQGIIAGIATSVMGTREVTELYPATKMAYTKRALGVTGKRTLDKDTYTELAYIILKHDGDTKTLDLMDGIKQKHDVADTVIYSRIIDENRNGAITDLDEGVYENEHSTKEEL